MPNKTAEPPAQLPLFDEADEQATSAKGEPASGDLGGLSGCAERGQGDARPALENRWKVGISASPKSVRRARIDAEMVLWGAVA